MHNLRELERVVLSSIIFEITPEKEEEIERLQIKDFFSIGHQDIFSAIKHLISLDKPFEEHLLSKYLIKYKTFDEQVMLEILSTTPMANISHYIDQIINERKKRDLELLASKMKIMITEQNVYDRNTHLLTTKDGDIIGELSPQRMIELLQSGRLSVRL